jgi:hypothetical protein
LKHLLAPQLVAPLYGRVWSGQRHYPVQHKPMQGTKLIGLPRVGGLHHRYEWKEAA